MSFWTWLFGEKEPEEVRVPIIKTFDSDDLTATIIYNLNGKQVEEVQYFIAFAYKFWNNSLADMSGTYLFDKWLEESKKTSFLKITTETKGFNKLIPLSSVVKITTETKARKITVQL